MQLDVVCSPSSRELQLDQVHEVNPYAVESFQRALAYFDGLQLQPEMQEVIREACRRGSEREQKEFHIFMHHLLPGGVREAKGPLRQNYGSAIAKQVSVHVSDYRKGVGEVLRDERIPDKQKLFIANPLEDFAKLTPDVLLPEDYVERALPSEHCDKDTIRGRLHPTMFARLLEQTDGIHPRDVYTVHGAYYDHCVRDILLQLWAARELEQYHPAIELHSGGEAVHVDLRHALGEIRNAIRAGMLMQSHRYRMGRVFDIDHSRYSLDNSISRVLLTEERVTRVYPEF